MSGDTRNLILAIALSIVVLFGWQLLFVSDEPAPTTTEQTGPGTSDVPSPTGQVGLPSLAGPTPALTRDEALARTERLVIDTPELAGSINLTGGRIDDVRLKNYRETAAADSPIITLFSPEGAPGAAFAETRWIPPAGVTLALPDATTQWRLAPGSAAALTPAAPVTLEWENGAGLVFTRTFAVDDLFMFTVTDAVRNEGTADTPQLFVYTLLRQVGTPVSEGAFLVHEGPIGVINGSFQNPSYSDIRGTTGQSQAAATGWIGFTDKYFATAIIPANGAGFSWRFFHTSTAGTERFDADYYTTGQSVAPGVTHSVQTRVFAGAKEVNVLEAYEAQGVERFELLVNWGWFYFLSRPMLIVIDWLYQVVGNFGVAILLATLLIKIIFFPLANRAYASMGRMRKAAPMMQEIRERYKDDRAKQQQMMIELYRKEKINPISGCLPILLQIPVFIALYQVLYVTIEMRHAPFFGWIRDLSAPDGRLGNTLLGSDTSSLFNLFGVLPFNTPDFLTIGIWPILMGITMWVQQKVNPPPPDRTTAMIFAWLPVVFTIMLAGFPAGLVIYWAWNNFLSVLQQTYIMRRQGVKVDLFDNLRATFRRKKAVSDSTE